MIPPERVEGSEGPNGNRAVLLYVPLHINRDNMTELSGRLLSTQRESPQTPVELHLTTRGGNTDSALELARIMRLGKTPVTTIASGVCYSSGVLLAAAGDPGKRFAIEGTEFMMHKPTRRVTDFTGDEADWIREAGIIQDYSKRLYGYLARLTGVTVKRLNELFPTKQEVFFSSEDAKELGIIDEILPPAK